MLNLAGIKRSSEYSPNHIETDSLILMRTTEVLIEMGASVNLYNEEDIGKVNIPEEMIFSMVQGERATEELLKYERSETKQIINPPSSVKNCYRVNMTSLLPEAGIPFPKSIHVKTSDTKTVHFDDFAMRKIWIKRGDVHAVHREDVTLVYSESEKISIMSEFEQRGITDVILQTHLDGDVVKFYAVKDSNLFHWYYLNGINHTNFDAKILQELAQTSAEVLGLYIYGGDAVIAKDGSIKIIDINDWPSFAPIKDKAATQIAKLIFNKAQNYEYGLCRETKISFNQD